jgi:hypothetical protein
MSPRELTGGAWRHDGRGVLRWVPDPPPERRVGRPRKPYTMHPAFARLMHQRYNAGERGEDVERGNAEYQRRWRREKRSA